MTEEQAKKSSEKKVETIRIMCEQLQIVPLARQMITKDGFLENVVFFNDTEKYNIDKVEEPKEIETKEKVEPVIIKKTKEEKNEDKQDKK